MTSALADEALELVEPPLQTLQDDELLLRLGSAARRAIRDDAMTPASNESDAKPMIMSPAATARPSG